MKTIISVSWLLLVLAISLTAQGMYQKYQTDKGIAQATFLSEYHGMEVAPEDAKFFNMVITSYDVTVEDMSIFTSGIK